MMETISSLFSETEKMLFVIRNAVCLFFNI